LLQGEIAAAARDYDYCYTVLRRVVCLSVWHPVHHIRARCLNRSTDLNAMYQSNDTFFRDLL